MTTTPLLQRLRARTRDDDRGAAMVTALMLIMVVGTLSVLVLGTLVSQVRPAALVQKTTRTIFAAEAGTQVALGELRTGLAGPDSNNDVYGDPAKLPCTLSGAVGEATSPLRYEVTVQYFLSDPAGMSATQRQAADMNCGAGGTGRGVATAPAYAVITARGLAAGVPGLATTSGNRTLETQYAFRVTNKNVPGGLFRTSDTAFCLEADNKQSGSAVRYRSDCSSRNDRMLWVHARQSYIQLASTIGSAQPLCLQSPAATGSTDPVRLRPCESTGSQLFSYKGYFRYQGQNNANSAPDARCLWAGSAAPVDGGELRSSAGGCVDESQGSTKVVRPGWSWNPEPAFAAGSASEPASLQLINYAEFGRCLEVTQENLDALNMGIGPCKQALPGNDNRWNQVWARTEPSSGSSSSTTALSVTNPYDQYDKRCLTTPSTTASPAYPVLRGCDPGQPDQRWVRTTQRSAYSTSYLLVDRHGRCLGGGPPYPVDDSTLTSVVVEACDGSLDQKWNAPPNTTPPGQSNTHEG